MTSITRIVALMAGLLLLFNITPSWGQPVCSQPGCNPTASDANFNTAGGDGALFKIDSLFAFDNTAFGYLALYNLTGGSVNTAVGSRALEAFTSGNGNTALGASALAHTTTGTHNTGTGFGSLFFNTSGSYNTASGYNALRSNTDGQFNVANGVEVLQMNTTGNSNTGTGSSALFSNTTGNQNTALGVAALADNTTGNRNTAVGTNALLQSTGNKNIAIGYQAGINLTSGSNNIYLGNTGVNSSESQTIRVGTAQTSTFIAGISAARVSGATVQIDTSTGQLGIAPSSVRYKQHIVPMGASSEGLLQLRPVSFAYKDDAQAITHYGLIAEEVATVYPDLVTRTASGEVQTVKYQELIPMLLNELQRQRHEFQQTLHVHQQALQSQQNELAELRALVGQGRGKVVLGGTE